MHLSIIPLADGSRVMISRQNDGYRVERDREGWVHAEVWIDYRDDEAVEDTKARAIGELDALDVWPALQRAVKAERRLADARAGSIRAAAAAPRDELTIAVERITSRLEREHGGVILP